MNINFSSYDDINNPYYAGGGTIAVHQVAKLLAKKHNVKVYTSSYWKSENIIREGVQYIRVGLPFNVGGKLSQFVFQLLLPVTAMLDKNYDVWIESFTPPYSTSFIPWFTNRTVIGLTHLLSGKEMSLKYKIPFDKIERIGIKQYKFIIALTTELKNSILEINPTCKVKVIPNGVEFPKKYVFNNLTKKHIFYIGRIDIYQKGLDILLKAYSLSNIKNKFDLVIAGHGRPSEILKLKKIIKRYKLENQVKLLGHVKGKTKSKLFKESVLSVVPSRFESFGLVVLEAFFYNVPVLAFDIEGLKWISDKYCYKAKSFDAEEFAQKMDHLISNEKLAQKLVEHAKIFIKRFDWKTIADEYEKFVVSAYQHEKQ